VILVDTSAWVEFLRGTGSTLHRTVRGMIGRGTDIAMTEPIVMEVMAGARTEREAARLRDQLLGFTFIQVQGLVDYETAASIHRVCRQHGQSIRGGVDALIAAVAIRSGAELLHGDADFDVIARHTTLRIAQIS
jgi:predicted nucleic acid-binding protein